MALVFAAEGVVRYVDRRPDFRFVSYRRGDRLFDLPGPIAADRISAHVEVDPRDWLARSSRAGLLAHTLCQSRGFAITLLVLDDNGDDADGE